MPNIEGSKKTNIKKKVSTFAVVFLLLFSVTFGTIAVPKPAHAQWLTTTLGDIPATIMRVLDKIKTLVGGQITLMAKIALIKAIDTYVSNYAYEAAIRSTSGAPGQKSLIQGKPMNIIAEEFAGAAVGDFLEQLSTEVFGRSLCKPLDPNLQLQIGIKLARGTKPAQPSCTIQKMFEEGAFSQTSVDNISNSWSNLKLKDTVKFAGYFNARQNTIGSLKKAEQELAYEKFKADKIARENYKDGFQDKLNQTETGVMLPASQVQAGLNLAYNTVADKSTTDKPNTDDPDNPYAAIAIQILSKGLSVFANTALGRILNQQYTTGLNPPPTKPSDFQSVVKTGLSAAKEYFNDLKNFQPLYIESDIDITSQLAACPQNKASKAWNNCRISSGTKDAIDNQLTLREAIDVSGDINGGAIFGYDASSGKFPRFDRGFPYSSLVVLRKYRVVPVGWELASQYIKDVMRQEDHAGHRTWTIQQVMDCYEDSDHPDNNRYPLTINNGAISCAIDASLDCDGVDPDDESDDLNDPGCVNPFYHLVNPNWVLKAPETKCYQEGPGPQIVYEQSIELPVDNFSATTNPSNNSVIEYNVQRIIARADYCANERGCIQEDKDGKCKWWGNCVLEKPIWRFVADSCPAEFNTCIALTKTQGAYESSSGVQNDEIGYISKTLEPCELSDVGCGWYSTYKDPNTGEWEGNTDIDIDIDGDGFVDGNGIADRVYLNDGVSTCSPSDVGCTLFYKAIDNSATADPVGVLTDLLNLGLGYESSAITTVHLKKAPEYLGCDGAIPSSECENYALQCSANEVGCMYYRPLNGDPAVPAKIISTDQCTEQCIGFSNFTYVPSWFEIDENDSYNPVADIVPDTAEQCTQAGCEAFTNLDEVASGGEGIEYYTQIRQCITPGAAGTKTYFTWEGSDTSGYQLKRWLMLEGAGGAPCTGVVPGDPGVCSVTASCLDLTNPVCRSFFDDAGNTYNAHMDEVIYSSEDCHPLRREITGTVYYGITTLSQQCSIENVDCREYKGASANNVQVIFSDTFEEMDADGTDAASLLFGWDGGVLSSESLSVSGHSFRFIDPAHKDVTNDVVEDYWYTLSFLAKGPGVIVAWFENAVTSVVMFPNVTITNEWQYYELGPIQLTQEVTDQEKLTITSDGNYIDNIILKGSPGTNLFIKNSWDIGLAQSCAAEGAFNCELYTPDEGDDIALRSFNQLCEDKFIGCIPVIDSFNSTRSTYTGDSTNPSNEITWNLSNNVPTDPKSNLDDITIAHDDLFYYVDDSDKYCVSSARGCRLVGIPEFDRQIDVSGNFSNCSGVNCQLPDITRFREATIIDSPDLYDSILCTGDELFCSLYTTPEGTSYSYIDTGTRVCEHSDVDGLWYKQGTEEECVSTGFGYYIPNQPLPSDDNGYDKWVGLCPTQHNSCSQLIDPEPVTSGEKIYYVLHNQLNQNDTAPCSQEGIVDRDGGCRLFADTENYSTNIPLYSDLAYDPDLSLDGAAPVSNALTSDNTANILIKVKPDRVCSEFLHCVSSLTFDNNDISAVRDNNTKSQQALCLGIGLCSRLDASGKCLDAEILGQNNVQAPQSINNSMPDNDNVELAQWSVGMSKIGASWPNGSVSGLYQYHAMTEIGAPLTIPNSNFEDLRNFNTLHSSWPDIDDQGNIMQDNVYIVGGSAGILPYEGNYMLEIEMTEPDDNQDAESFITSAILPATPGMETALSFYVNFDALRQKNAVNLCVAGHRDRIGTSCVADADCMAGTSTCTDLMTGGFCELSIASTTPIPFYPSAPIYDDCSHNSQCDNGRGDNCTYWECTTGALIGVECDPNNVMSNWILNSSYNADCSLINGIFSIGGTCSPNSVAGRMCTNGANNLLGQACVIDSDCDVPIPASVGAYCQPVGSILKVDILNGDASGSYDTIDIVVEGVSGWQQVTIPFTIPSAGQFSQFRIRLTATNEFGVADPAVGSIMIDGLEVRSGLETGTHTVVAPSCRLYPRTDGLETDALACDFVDRGNISGDRITTYKGWRGYCVEEVPDQPGICMNWWPVDIVQGDVNLLGSGNVVDIDYANNLYYCLHSTGNISLPIQTSPKNYLQTFGTYVAQCETTCEWDVTVPSVYQIYKSQISHMASVWTFRYSHDWPTGGARFFLEPQDGNPDRWEYNWSGQNGDSFYVHANFHPTTNRLTSLRSVVRDPSDDDGGGQFHFQIYLRDVCQTIARVNTSDGFRTPWVDRFNKADDPALFYSLKDEDKNPFGAIVPPSNDFEPFESNYANPWWNENTPIYGMAQGATDFCPDANNQAAECARASTAYSCFRDCGAKRTCIEGSDLFLGNPCDNHKNCVETDEFNTSIGKGVCGGYIVSNSDKLSTPANAPWTFDTGVTRLSKLFAKSYGIYGWDYEAEEYVKCDSTDPTGMPATCTYPASGHSLPIGATSILKDIPITGQTNQSVFVVDDYDITGCGWVDPITADPFKYNGTAICGNFDASGLAPEVNNFVVNKSVDDININSGQFVTLRFYPTVNKNRQPLKSMRIDWGDGTAYKPNQDLSNLAGEGLPVQTYFFIHQYICDSNSNSIAWNPATEECEFVPKIQLKDNWGWCTGDIYECAIDEGWIEYTGVIYSTATSISSGSCAVDFATDSIRAGGSTSVTVTFGNGSSNQSLRSMDNYTYTFPQSSFVTGDSFSVDSDNHWLLRTETHVLSMDDITGSLVECSDTLTIEPTIPSCTLSTTLVWPESSLNFDVSFDWTSDYATRLTTPNINDVIPTPPIDNGSITIPLTRTATQGMINTIFTAENNYGDSNTCNADIYIIPNAPSNLLVSNVSTVDNVVLNWVDNSQIESGFRIERSPDGSSNWSEIGTTGPNVSTFVDNGLTSSSNAYHLIPLAGSCICTHVGNSTSYNQTLLEKTITLFQNLFKVNESLAALPLCFQTLPECTAAGCNDCSLNTPQCPNTPGDPPFRCDVFVPPSAGACIGYDASACPVDYIQLNSTNGTCTDGASYEATRDCVRAYYRVTAISQTVVSVPSTTISFP